MEKAIRKKVKHFLHTLNDGVNHYDIDVNLIPDTDIEMGRYTVENRELGYFIMGSFPVLEAEANSITLELHNCVGRGIQQTRLSQLFGEKCGFTGPYSANVHILGMTGKELEDFFDTLDERMQLIKEEFPFTGEE